MEETMNVEQGDRRREAKVRPMAAGSSGFYPTEPENLRQMLDRFLEVANGHSTRDRIEALICPHAGYVYCGQVAAYAYANLVGRHYDTVVILGPSHYVAVEGAAVSLADYFATPLGDVPVDTDACRWLIENVEGVVDSDDAHAQEHSIEVQLPWLQMVLNGFKIVPITLGMPSIDMTQRLGAALKQIGANREMLIIVSTDLSHYHTHESASMMDRRAIDAIMAFDTGSLYQQLLENTVELCGGAAVLTMMQAITGHEDLQIDFLSYEDSGAITGDRDHVVGYAALLIQSPLQSKQGTGLDEQEKAELLGIARSSIEKAINNEELDVPESLSTRLSEKSGAFVTLKLNNELRGCIGYIAPVFSLAETVQKAAVAAALEDPRFPAVTAEEMSGITIEISALTPLEPVTDREHIEIGHHGLYLEKGPYKGLLLPQVAMELGCSRDEFLDQTCIKAGLTPGAWQEPDANIFCFSAEVFGERD